MDFLPVAYAVKWESNIRSRSASGSFFPAIASYIINEKNGYVCGCVLENMVPIHIVSNCWSDVERMQDSKYVQSNMGNCYSQICDLLIHNIYVLFTGTSCQTKGLLEYLNIKRVKTEQLFTIDFFCHGVPSPLLWREFLNYYSTRYNREVVGYRFRPKNFGWRRNNHLNSIFYKKGKTIKEDNWSYLGSHIWDSLFYGNMCLRPSCYECKFATCFKPSDFTMGDFWGIEDCATDFDDDKGCSVVIVHNQKSFDFINKLGYITKKEVSVESAVLKQINAKGPCKKPDNRSAFWECYYKFGFGCLIKNFCAYNFKRRLRAYFNRILFQLGLRNRS